MPYIDCWFMIGVGYRQLTKQPPYTRLQSIDSANDYSDIDSENLSCWADILNSVKA